MPQYVEDVSTRTIEGHKIGCCGTFKYLGTMVSQAGGVATELQRRKLLAVNGVKTLPAAFIEDANQIDNRIGTVDSGCN